MNIFPIERTQDDDMTGVNTITKKAFHHFSGHRIISMQEGVHMVDDQELVICSDSMTYVSIKQITSRNNTGHEIRLRRN